MVVVVVVAAAALFRLVGGAWFVVETPSMGRAAPVGTLVLDAPAPRGSLRVGQVISFHPPGRSETVFTHRIAALLPNGTIATKGDINGSVDPWRLSPTALVGRAFLLLPGLGWVVRWLPLLIGGGAVLWIATGSLSSRRWRFALRLDGLSLLVSLAICVSHPLENAVLISTDLSGATGRATVVSTGLLPVRISAAGGAPVDLSDGQVGVVAFSPSATAHYQLLIAPNLTAAGWAALFGVCCTPLAWSGVLTLRRRLTGPPALG